MIVKLFDVESRKYVFSDEGGNVKVVEGDSRTNFRVAYSVNLVISLEDRIFTKI